MPAARRAPQPDDAILGVAPRVVYAPATVDECADVLRLTARENQHVAFVGGGTELALGRPPEALDVVVRTERLARVVEYAPSDMVVIAEAGVTLASVQAVAREHRQMLAIDPPQPGRATIGGLVSTAGFGPRRARYGGLRDLIIGVTLVRADGVVARGGGKVVKNVAGFDLPKVACGALGTLGMIATATFRLHPVPETGATVRCEGLSAEKVALLLAAARDAQVEESAAVALRAGGAAFELGIGVEGFAAGVRQGTARLVELARVAGATASVLAEPEAAGFWSRHDAVRAGGPLRVKIATLPARLPAIDALLAQLAAALRGASLAWYGTLGLGFVAGDPIDSATACAALVALREALVASGGSLVVEAAPAEIRASVDPWGPTGSSFPIMAALKQRFDPGRRLNPGRFLGGL